MDAWSGFDDVTRLHYGDAVREGCGEVGIVRDKQAGQITRVLKAADRFYHLRLHQHIEHRCGFIQDEHLWAHQQSTYEGQTLELPAAYLPGEAFEEVWRQVERVQERCCSGPCIGRAAEAMDRKDLSNRSFQLPARVKGGFGVL